MFSWQRRGHQSVFSKLLPAVMGALASVPRFPQETNRLVDFGFAYVVENERTVETGLFQD